MTDINLGGLAYDTASQMACGPADTPAKTRLYHAIRKKKEKQYEELLLCWALENAEWFNDFAKSEEFDLWATVQTPDYEFGKPPPCEVEPSPQLLLDWADEEKPQLLSGHDHWGDPFEHLGEPTEEELQPRDILAAVQRGRGAVERASVRKPTLQVDPKLSLLTQHLRSSGGYYPDAVIDTLIKRKRASRALYQRLKKLADREGVLKFYSLSLSELNDYCLYAPAIVAAAKKSLGKWMHQHHITRCEWKLERGREGGTHLHVVAASVATASGQDVYDLEGLACYLVKPPDARANRPKLEDKQRYTCLELERQKHRAAEEWLQAAALCKAQAFGKRQKLPRLYGTFSIRF